MKKYLLLLLFSSFCSIDLFARQAMVTVGRTTVEGLNVMEGVTKIHPRLSWQIESAQRNVSQTAYQIIVASSMAAIGQNKGDVYDSRKVNSNQSINIAYPLVNLLSCRPYYWRVRVWTSKGASKWSATGKWSMGILNDSIWKADWIGTEKMLKTDDPYNPFTRLAARYLRKELTVSVKPIRATAYIAGMGLYELYVNGLKVGKHVLSPTLKEYNKEIPYNTLDVTAYFKKGSNAIGVILGNGRYFTVRYSKDGGMAAGNAPSTHYGLPMLKMQVLLEYANGTKELITSDRSWKATSNGPIIANNEFDGEEYDANKELTGWSLPNYKDKDWYKVSVVTPASNKLVTQVNENIAVKDNIVPKTIHQTKNRSYILDMGQNMVGWLKIKVRGKKGDTITLRFAETLKNADSLFLANIRSAKVTDKYVIKGTGEELWEPRFVFHGFRYAEVRGLKYQPKKEDFTGRVVYDDLPTIGLFQTSDKTINQVYKNAYWGIIGNYRGMPTDCPQRDERMGWLGDRSVSSYGESFVFDNSRLYAKWMDDIEAAQKESGSIPDVAPTYWKNYTDNVTWPITFLVIPEMLRKQFGDTVTYQKQYPNMKKWMLYMWDTYQVDDMVQKDTYGDWCLPPENLNIIFSLDTNRNTKGPVIGAAYYYYALSLMKKYADRLKNSADYALFDGMAKKVRAAFNAEFYNQDGGFYANNTVTSNLLPLTFGIVEEKNREKVFRQIVDRTLNLYQGHVSTGLIGGQWLMRGLSDNGRPDLAYKIVTNTTYPSWGYMAAQGATTIWELWNGNTADPAMNSGNHVMLLGDLLVWNYEYLGGIKTDQQDVAFKKIIMDPYLAPALTFVNASTTSPYGKIVSNWKKNGKNFSWEVSIPSNCKAILAFPVSSFSAILENNRKLSGINEIKYLRTENGKTYVEVASGNYVFSCKF
ncbi:MAG: alpha-rhamnosidase [Pedobacter sp.]|nr:MAG: alpha-rhamnosidase [Pedobacter sp.]